MKILTKEEFENSEKDFQELPEKEKEEVINNLTNKKVLSTEKLVTDVSLFEQPLEMQKELASKIKAFVDLKIEEELRDSGSLSDFTRKWVHEYNELLDKLHKNIFGDKSLNLHLHKVSHAQISNMINKYKDKEGDKFDEEVVEGSI